MILYPPLGSVYQPAKAYPSLDALGSVPYDLPYTTCSDGEPAEPPLPLKYTTGLDMTLIPETKLKYSEYPSPLTKKYLIVPSESSTFWVHARSYPLLFAEIYVEMFVALGVL